MILLKKIQLTNFLSHSNTTINFKLNQKLSIEGASGAGKSSIAEGLIFALYNKGRIDNKFLIKKGTKEATVTVILYEDKENKEYIIERSINNKNKHTFNVSEKEGKKKITPIKASGKKEIQEYLEKNILKASYLLFINSIVYLQNNTETFVNQTANKRKDIVLEIINANYYDEYLKKAKELISKSKTDVAVISSKIEGVQVIIDESTKNSADIEKLKKEKEEKEKEKEEIKKSLDSLLKYKEELVERINKVKIEKEKIQAMNEQIEKINVKKENTNKKIIEMSTVDIKSLEQKISELPAERKKMEEIQKEEQEYYEWMNKYNELLKTKPMERGNERIIEDLNKKIIAAMNQKIDKCPELDKICPILENNRQKELEKFTEEINYQESQIEEYKKLSEDFMIKMESLGKKDPVDRNEVEKVKKIIAELEVYEKELIESKNNQSIIDTLNKDLIELENEHREILIEKNKIKVEDIDGIEKEVEMLSWEITKKEKEIENLSSELQNAIIELSGAEKALITLKENKEKMKNLLGENDKLKDNLTSLGLVKDAFGPNGIKAIIIDYILPELEDKINDILGRLSDFRIKLETQKSGLGKDTVLEGLFVNIINPEGEELSFSSYSGGEKMRITMAISEGFAAISKCNFRIMDEAIIGLDEETVESFSEVISKIQKDISQLVIISHLPQVKDLFGEKILISKINGNSQIKHG